MDILTADLSKRLLDVVVDAVDHGALLNDHCVHVPHRLVELHHAAEDAGELRVAGRDLGLDILQLLDLCVGQALLNVLLLQLEGGVDGLVLVDPEGRLRSAGLLTRTLGEVAPLLLAENL